MRPGYYGCENALMRHINSVLSHLGIQGRFLKNPDTHLIRLKLEPGVHIRLHPIVSSMLGFDENYISVFTSGFGSDMRCAPHFRQH